MKVFNKLVRDKIPEIIASKGEFAKTRILDNDEYKKELDKKLLDLAGDPHYDDTVYDWGGLYVPCHLQKADRSAPVDVPAEPLGS